MNDTYAGDVPPRKAWEMLESDPGAVLVDVRTPAEWGYVGVPDLSSLGKQPVFVPWVLYPNMDLNVRFMDQIVESGVPVDAPVLLLCRSGVRSKAAAVAMTRLGYSACYNIAHGFEGDPDGERHRGTVSGWKVDGLPWRQG